MTSRFLTTKQRLLAERVNVERILSADRPVRCWLALFCAPPPACLLAYTHAAVCSARQQLAKDNLHLTTRITTLESKVAAVQSESEALQQQVDVRCFFLLHVVGWHQLRMTRMMRCVCVDGQAGKNHIELLNEAMHQLHAQKHLLVRRFEDEVSEARAQAARYGAMLTCNCDSTCDASCGLGCAGVCFSCAISA